MRYAIRRQFLWFGIGFVLAIMIGSSASQKGMYDRSEPSASVAAVRSNAPANKIITETSSIEKTATAKDSEKVQVQWTANESWKRSKLQDHRVRLLINDQTEILLKQSHLHVKVDGFRARVVLDLQFAKAAQDRTEATFQLRLANGANPYYLAFGNTQYAIGDQSAAMRSQEIQKILNKSHAIKDIQQGAALNNVAMREARFAPKKRAAQAYHDTVRRKVDAAYL